jgi:hypothetical protein
MEEQGIIGPGDGEKPREILVSHGQTIAETTDTEIDAQNDDTDAPEDEENTEDDQEDTEEEPDDDQQPAR